MPAKTSRSTADVMWESYRTSVSLVPAPLYKYFTDQARTRAGRPAFGRASTLLPRRRTLSTSEHKAGNSCDSPPHSQLDCAFLTRLPLEIREQIYRLVFGNVRIGLECKERVEYEGAHRLDVGRRLRLYGEGFTLDYGYNYSGVSAEGLPPLRGRGDEYIEALWRMDRRTLGFCHSGHNSWCWGDSLTHYGALLRTCQQIYNETIDMLYSERIFSTSSAPTIARLPDLILPQRLQQIQTLRLTMEFGEGLMKRETTAVSGYESNVKRTWYQIWTTMIAMNGLQDLRIWLWVGGQDLSPYNGAEGPMLRGGFLDPVRTFCATRRLERFDLALPLYDDVAAIIMIPGCRVSGGGYNRPADM